MKKFYLSQLSLWIVLIISLLACNNSTQVKPCPSEQDQQKINDWNILFLDEDSSSNKESDSLWSRDVSSKYADACVAAYYRLYHSTPPDCKSIIDSYTESISFSKNGDDNMGQGIGHRGKRFMLWYLECAKTKEFTHLRLRTGIYLNPDNDPSGHSYDLPKDVADYIKNAKRPNGKPLIGSMTVFLSPWKIVYKKDANGHRVIDTVLTKKLTLKGGNDDFNLGDIQP